MPRAAPWRRCCPGLAVPVQTLVAELELEVPTGVSVRLAIGGVINNRTTFSAICSELLTFVKFLDSNDETDFFIFGLI